MPRSPFRASSSAGDLLGQRVVLLTVDAAAALPALSTALPPTADRSSTFAAWAAVPPLGSAMRGKVDALLASPLGRHCRQTTMHELITEAVSVSAASPAEAALPTALDARFASADDATAAATQSSVAAAVQMLRSPENEPPNIAAIEESLRAVLMTDPSDISAFTHYVWLLQEHVFVPVRAREHAVQDCAPLVRISISSPHKIRRRNGRAAAPAHMHDQHELASTVRGFWSRRVYGDDCADGAPRAIAWTVYAVVQGAWVPELSRESVSSVVASCRCALATSATFAPASFVLATALQAAWHLVRSEQRLEHGGSGGANENENEILQMAERERETAREEGDSDQPKPVAEWINEICGEGGEGSDDGSDDEGFGASSSSSGSATATATISASASASRTLKPDHRLLARSLACFRRAAAIAGDGATAVAAFPLAAVGLGLMLRMLHVIAQCDSDAEFAEWANVALDEHEGRDSEALFEQAIAADPYIPSAYIAMGQLRVDVASRVRALAAEGGGSFGESGTGMSEMEAERAYTQAAADARHCFALALALDQHTAVPHFALARLCHEDALRASVDAALAQRHARALIAAGDAFTEHDIALEEEICRRAAIAAVRECAAAKGHYEAALRTNRYHAPSWFWLGMLQIDVEDDAEGAEQSFLSAAKADPTMGPPHNHLAVLLFHRGGKQEAEELYRWALSKCATTDCGISRPRWWCRSGGCFGLHYRFFAGAGPAQQLDSCGVEQADAAYNLAVLLDERATEELRVDEEAALEMANEAAELYRLAVKLEPSLSAAWVNLGVLLESPFVHRREEALLCYRNAIAVDGDDARAHNNLGALLFSEALAMLVDDDEASIITAVAPGDPNAIGGSQSSRTALVDEAEAAFETAITLDASNTAALYGLSDLLARERHNSAGAQRCWSAIIAHDVAAPLPVIKALHSSLFPERCIDTGNNLADSFLSDDAHRLCEIDPTSEEHSEIDPFVFGNVIMFSLPVLKRSVPVTVALLHVDDSGEVDQDEDQNEDEDEDEEEDEEVMKEEEETATAKEEEREEKDPAREIVAQGSNANAPPVAFLAETYAAIARMASCWSAFGEEGADEEGVGRRGSADAAADADDADADDSGDAGSGDDDGGGGTAQQQRRAHRHWLLRRTVAHLCWTRCLELSPRCQSVAKLLSTTYDSLVERYSQSRWTAEGGDAVAAHSLQCIERLRLCGARSVEDTATAMVALAATIQRTGGPTLVAQQCVRRAMEMDSSREPALRMVLRELEGVEVKRDAESTVVQAKRSFDNTAARDTTQSQQQPLRPSTPDELKVRTSRQKESQSLPLLFFTHSSPPPPLSPPPLSPHTGWCKRDAASPRGVRRRIEPLCALCSRRVAEADAQRLRRRGALLSYRD